MKSSAPRAPSARLARCIATLFSIYAIAQWTPSAAAQEVTASITGQVTDPSGAVISGAKVTATDQQRGTEWPTTTNGDGTYNLLRLPIGTYNLTVEQPGFQTAKQTGIQLVLNQVARLDISLQVGTSATVMEVNSTPPLLQTQSMELGTVIDAQTNVQIPLATRNYIQLTLLAPGAVTPDPSGFKGSQTTFNSARPYINGNREQSNNFVLDGMDNNQISDNLVAYAPSVDAIQEFNEITQNASAEFGNFMGGITSVSIKSGTNQFHGDAFEFVRNDKLNANEWYENLTGQPKPLLRWNEFGGSLGGPIKKDKLFIFGDYQGSRFDTPASTGTISVLTPLERQGNFSQLLVASVDNPTPTQLYNPYVVQPNGNRMPFAGNIIPVQYLSKVALNIINSQYYPAATNSGLRNNQTNTSHSYTNGDQGDVKVDYNISDKDHFFGRYSQSYITNPTTNSQPLDYNSFGVFPVHNGVLDYTRTVTPSIVNDLRGGVNYMIGNTGTSASSLPNLAQQFGIPGVQSDILPSQTISGGFANSIGNSDNVQLFATTVIQYGDTVIWTKGNHTLKFGFQGFRNRVDTFYSGNNGVAGLFTYNGQFTTLNPGLKYDNSSTTNGGLPEADFLLGLPEEVGVGTNGGTWGQRYNILGTFAQDTWRVTPKLTLDLGLRWQLNTPWVEVKNRQANFAPFSGQVEIAGQSTYYNNNRALYNQYNGIYNFQPRLGIAYSPTQHTVVRASYSLSSYMEGTGTNLRLTINPPFSTERDALYSALALPSTNLDQGYAPIGSPTNIYQGVTVRLWDPNVRPAVNNQWNFSVQQQFGSATTLQTSYVGQKNDHLVVAQPYQQKILNPDGTVSPSPYLAGNPLVYNSIGQISGTETNGNQSYNALQVVLKRNMAQGLQGQLSYTYSKCMTDSIGFYGDGGQSASTSAYTQNLYNRAAEWGPCYFDVAHNVSGFITYDLPFGHHRMFGANANKFVNAVLGDWTANAIVSFHTGLALTINGSDNSGTNARGARADCIAPGQVFGHQNYGGSGGGFQYFNTSSYVQPSAGTFGSCGVGTLRGPGLATADISASKQFFFTEHQNLELRGEFINAFNHPILNSPDTFVGDSTFGVIQSSQGARNIQIALKYNF
ncbi:MAG TPA: carboxypeptidase regulatory-like domain-containing protein [Bryobacteraceae bacterium]|nr:carboxypeptidase regulatory-like domain-containing protein [Bryobacteraceae bacterium]